MSTWKEYDLDWWDSDEDIVHNLSVIYSDNGETEERYLHKFAGFSVYSTGYNNERYGDRKCDAEGIAFGAGFHAEEGVTAQDYYEGYYTIPLKGNIVQAIEYCYNEGYRMARKYPTLDYKEVERMHLDNLFEGESY